MGKVFVAQWGAVLQVLARNSVAECEWAPNKVLTGEYGESCLNLDQGSILSPLLS